MSSVGLIKWEDIVEIETQQVVTARFLLIYTSNPDHYLEKVKGYKKKLLEANYRMYDTPFSVTSNPLQYDFDDLEKLLRERFLEQSDRILSE